MLGEEKLTDSKCKDRICVQQMVAIFFFSKEFYGNSHMSQALQRLLMGEGANLEQVSHLLLEIFLVQSQPLLLACLCYLPFKNCTPVGFGPQHWKF